MSRSRGLPSLLWLSLMAHSNENGRLDEIITLLDRLAVLTGEFPDIAIDLQLYHDSIALLIYEGRRRDHKEALVIAAVGIGAQRYTDIIRETGLPPPTVARILQRLVDEERVLEQRHAPSGPLYSLQRPARPGKPPPGRRFSL